MVKRLNIILDIDNTIVEYVYRGGENALRPLWDGLSAEERAKYIFADGFVLRPGFVEFFNGMHEHFKSVSLWTWSDREYAEGVKDIIEARTNCRVKNVWCDEEAQAGSVHVSEDWGEASGDSKDLKYVWEVLDTSFKPCDTIIIDDLRSNSGNGSNYKNGIQIAKFALWDSVKRTEPPQAYRDQSGDTALAQVLEALKKINSKPHLCRDKSKSTFDCLASPLNVAYKIGGTRRRKTNKKKTYRKKK